MQTWATNADQHPGYAHQQPHQVEKAAAKPKTKKRLTAEAKAEKAAAKMCGAAHVTKFEQGKMEREDILDATPSPLFTPVAGDSLMSSRYYPLLLPGRGPMQKLLALSARPGQLSDQLPSLSQQRQ